MESRSVFGVSLSNIEFLRVEESHRDWLIALCCDVKYREAVVILNRGIGSFGDEESNHFQVAIERSEMQARRTFFVLRVHPDFQVLLHARHLACGEESRYRLERSSRARSL